MAKKHGGEVVLAYQKITCLEKAYADMKTQELELLSAEVYNALVLGLIPKRKVLLNELLDMETEIRIRSNKK